VSWLKEGDAAPDFTQTTHTGETVTLSKLRGKWVVLWFYPAASTPGCTREGCGFRDLKAEFDKKNAVLLGCSKNSVAANKKFADAQRFTFPLLCDTDGKVAIAYGAAEKAGESAKRSSYLIDPKGKIAKVWPHKSVDVGTHPTEMLASIKS
jgi:peroxiredoxin Q/BCP